MDKLILFVTLCLSFQFATAENCPKWLNHTLPALHSSSSTELCSVINNRPVLLVNTASYCGFTHQFASLQKLHKRYNSKGLTIIGFPSNDFRQEAKTEQKTASICYENFGVTFTMVSPIQVRGVDAHPIFKYLASNSRPPSWNFNKYLVSADGKHITHFDASIDPNSEKMIQAIEQLIQ